MLYHYASDDDIVWTECAYQIAQLCANLVLIASPERISIGGGVMNRASLYPKIRVSYCVECLYGSVQLKLNTRTSDLYLHCTVLT